jgi:hypothetical protein
MQQKREVRLNELRDQFLCQVFFFFDKLSFTN